MEVFQTDFYGSLFFTFPFMAEGINPCLSCNGVEVHSAVLVCQRAANRVYRLSAIAATLSELQSLGL